MVKGGKGNREKVRMGVKGIRERGTGKWERGNRRNSGNRGNRGKWDQGKKGERVTGKILYKYDLAS